MSAARSQARLSAHFFATATGSASHGRCCWNWSAARTIRVILLIAACTYPDRGGLWIYRPSATSSGFRQGWARGVLGEGDGVGVGLVLGSWLGVGLLDGLLVGLGGALSRAEPDADG